MRLAHIRGLSIWGDGLGAAVWVEGHRVRQIVTKGLLSLCSELLVGTGGAKATLVVTREPCQAAGPS